MPAEPSGVVTWPWRMLAGVLLVATSATTAAIAASLWWAPSEGPGPGIVLLEGLVLLPVVPTMFVAVRQSIRPVPWRGVGALIAVGVCEAGLGLQGFMAAGDGALRGLGNWPLVPMTALVPVLVWLVNARSVRLLAPVAVVGGLVVLAWV